MADTEERIEPERTGTSEGAEYTPPQLERLGEWKALTLQQSVPIGAGSLRAILDPRRGLD